MIVQLLIIIAILLIPVALEVDKRISRDWWNTGKYIYTPYIPLVIYPWDLSFKVICDESNNSEKDIDNHMINIDIEISKS